MWRRPDKDIYNQTQVFRKDYSEISQSVLVKADSTRPDILVICTPWGGLTNVKQRLFDCIKRTTNEHPDKDVRFVTPWLMARPIAGPFVPLDLVFKLDHWIHWMQSNGFQPFKNSSLDWRNTVLDVAPHKQLNYYNNHLQSWAEHENVTVMKIIGNLVPIDRTFGVDAFVLRDDLIPGMDEFVLEESCSIHARIESDWIKYSGVSKF